MKTSNAIIIILLLAMCTSIQAEQKVIVKDSNGGKNIFNLHSRIVLDLTKEKFVVRNDTRSIVYTSSDERILLLITEDNKDAMDGVKADNSREDVFYDLSGRKITNPAKGIYIKDGKKVVLK